MTESENFDRAIYKILRDESPVEDVTSLSPEERRMVQMAQIIRGAGSDQGAGDELRSRLTREIKEQGRGRISRRSAVLAGLGSLAAGLAAGVGLKSELGQTSNRSSNYAPLVGAKGRWVRVADAADVPEGTVKSFVAGPVRGFLIHRNGQLRAISGICTHMGCLLTHQAGRNELTCPCHGAEFGLDGQMVTYSAATDDRLPPLPKIGVRVRNEAIEVWTV